MTASGTHRETLTPRHPDTSVIEEDGVVAVVRLNDLGPAVPLTEALVAGGVRAVEFTFTNPAAAGAITAAREAMGSRALVGAGSVLDAETARIAILAGAAFVVTPTVSLPVITMCQRYAVATIIGALTPTEILTAWEGGATYVKVFPASVGGPRYLRDVLAPLPQVKLVPTGGVDVENAGEFIRAGAVAVALGSNLVSPRAVASGDWESITNSARAISEAIAQARRPLLA